MQKNNKVCAILCSDIHLSHTAPVFRSNEPDWYEAMKRPLLELQQLYDKYFCPILCAGDIFDKWNSPPELINFALEYLPDSMYAIPGQHDLPLHNLDDIKKSAYWTLVKAGKIKNFYTNDRYSKIVSDSEIEGFPFGISPTSNSDKSQYLQIALIHQYVWIPKHSYPNAPEGQRLKHIQKQLKGYDVAVFGDNHSGFQCTFDDIQVFNCGTLMRRKSDEINYKPQVGLLYSDGHIEPYYLDISKDKHLTTVDKESEKEDLDVSDFVKELESLGETALDFTDAVKRYFDGKKTNKEIINIVLKAMEKK